MHGKTFSESHPEARPLTPEKAAKLIQKSGKTFSESARNCRFGQSLAATVKLAVI
jgi:hypothetical protein